MLQKSEAITYLIIYTRIKNRMASSIDRKKNVYYRKGFKVKIQEQTRFILDTFYLNFRGIASIVIVHSAG